MTPAERANLEYTYDKLMSLYNSGDIGEGELDQLYQIDDMLRSSWDAEAAQSEREAQPTIQSREPTVSEDVGDWWSDKLYRVSGDTPWPMSERESQSMGRKIAGLLDITPMIGGGMSAAQAKRDVGAGNYGDAAMNAIFGVLDVVPAMAATRSAARTARGAAPGGRAAKETVESGVNAVRSVAANPPARVAEFLADESGALPLPPLSNAQRTQIAGTFPTYKKAMGLLDTEIPEGRTLDFGAGLGMSRDLGFDTYEPFPRAGFDPTYRSAADIPDASYDRLTNLNVLNVVPREVRDQIVSDIGRVLKPGGVGVITTRGRDVMAAKGMAGPEPMSVITSADTYQKGFSQRELQEYLQSILGEAYGVSPVRLGPAGAMIRRNY